MKKLLIVFGIIVISLEIALYFFWYKELYFLEFFVMVGLCHFANTSIFFGILTETLPKRKRKLIINLSFILLASFFLIIYINGIRTQNRIDNEGTLIKGIVVKKKYGAKSSPWLENNFDYDGITYKSTLHISDIRDFDKVRLKDSVLIKFIKKYPKLNRTEKLINE